MDLFFSIFFLMKRAVATSSQRFSSLRFSGVSGSLSGYSSPQLSSSLGASSSMSSLARSCCRGAVLTRRGCALIVPDARVRVSHSSLYSGISSHEAQPSSSPIVPEHAPVSRSPPSAVYSLYWNTRVGLWEGLKRSDFAPSSSGRVKEQSGERTRTALFQRALYDRAAIGFPAVDLNGRVCSKCIAQGELCNEHTVGAFVPGEETRAASAIEQFEDRNHSDRILEQLKIPGDARASILREFHDLASAPSHRSAALSWLLRHVYALQSTGELVRDVFESSVASIFASSSPPERVVFSRLIADKADIVNWAETDLGVSAIISLIEHGERSARNFVIRAIVKDTDLSVHLLSHAKGHRLLVKIAEIGCMPSSFFASLERWVADRADDPTFAKSVQMYRSLELLAGTDALQRGDIETLASCARILCEGTEGSVDVEVARMDLTLLLSARLNDPTHAAWTMGRYADLAQRGALHVCQETAHGIYNLMRSDFVEEEDAAAFATRALKIPSLVDRLRRSVIGSRVLESCSGLVDGDITREALAPSMATWEVNRATSPLMCALVNMDRDAFHAPALGALLNASQGKWNDATFILATVLLGEQEELGKFEPKGTPVSFNAVQSVLERTDGSVREKYVSSLVNRFSTLKRSSRNFDAAATGLAALGDYLHLLTVDQHMVVATQIAQHARHWGRETHASPLLIMGLQLIDKDARDRCARAIVEASMMGFKTWSCDRTGHAVVKAAWGNANADQRRHMETITLNHLGQLGDNVYGRDVLVGLLPLMSASTQEKVVEKMKRDEAWFHDDERFVAVCALAGKAPIFSNYLGIFRSSGWSIAQPAS